MAWKVGKRDKRIVAKLVVDNRAPCAFCNRDFDDEVSYGKLYAIGNIQCHYFCVLLSCCLVQKGPEEEGLFGFMYKDILAELERSKKHKCSYCSRGGANLGCSVSSCRKQFHLPCGRERNAVSLYFGTYKSFCQQHAPKQSIPEHIMSKAKLRMKGVKAVSTQVTSIKESTEDESMVCVICYETVHAFPSVNTFWPPCCGKDEWFHRTCLQRMALSAGMHYLKCPLCNDKENFYDAVIGQGYYVPDRDAAWELEQNAFAEIYERPLNCTVETCQCPLGRNHDSDQGMWDIKLCLLCGSVGAHAHCIGASETTRYVCLTCTPAAPEDLQALADVIEKMILEEQAATAVPQHGPVMPSRMSIRRTKGRSAYLNRPSSSRSYDVKTECESLNSSITLSSRQELHLTTPRKPIQTRGSHNGSPYNSSVKHSESYNNEMMKNELTPKKESSKIDCMMSPMRLLEQSFNEKVCMGVNNLDENVVEMLRAKFKKPGPFREKQKIVNDLLNGLFNDLNTSEKNKERLKEWCSPKKNCEVVEKTQKKEVMETPRENTKESPRITRNNKNISTINEEITDKATVYKQSVEEEVSLKEDEELLKEDMVLLKDNILIVNEEELITNQDVVIDVCNEATKKILKKTESKLKQRQNNDLPVDENIKKVDEEVKSESNDVNITINNKSSNSTFELPSEFIADTISDNSNSVFNTPRKTNDIHRNVNVKKDVSKENKFAFKFSPLDSEKLEKKNRDIDLETFKQSYLNEYGINSSSYKQNGNMRVINNKLVSPVKTEVDIERKRKLSEGNLLLVFNKNIPKKTKLSENDLELGSSDDFEEKKELDTNDRDRNKFRVKITSNRIKKAKSDRAKKREKIHESSTDVTKSQEENISSKDDEIQEGKIDKLNDKIKNTAIKPKRKLHESSQWMDEMTQLDKKLQIEAEKKAKKKEMRSKNKLIKDELTKKALQSSEGVREKRIETQNKQLNNNENVSEVVESAKLNDEKIIKEIRQAKRDKKLKLKQKRNKSNNFKKDKKYRDKQEKNKDRNIELTIDSCDRKSNKKNNKLKTKLSITNNEKDISVKIKWKKKQLQLKIESKKQKVENDHSKFKQYVLQYFSEITPKQVVVRPEKEVSPLKRKYVKQDKLTPDKLKQMSIQNFFKTKSPDT